MALFVQGDHENGTAQNPFGERCFWNAYKVVLKSLILL